MQTFIIYFRDGQSARVRALKFAAGTRFGKDSIDFYTADESKADKNIYVAGDAVACVVSSELVDSEAK